MGAAGLVSSDATCPDVDLEGDVIAAGAVSFADADAGAAPGTGVMLLKWQAQLAVLVVARLLLVPLLLLVLQKTATNLCYWVLSMEAATARPRGLVLF